jgi:hypothetical protein
MIFLLQEGLQMKKRFSEEQIIRILREVEGSGSIREVCRKNNITEQSFFRADRSSATQSICIVGLRCPRANRYCAR